MPNGASAKNCCAVFSGSIIEKNLDPSRGGTGIRLRNPNARLNLTKMRRAEAISGTEVPITLRSRAPINASPKLVRGPARATSAISFLPSRSISGLTGTGFAAPNTKGEPENIKRSGTATLIIGSMWGRGLRVRRPAIRAVGSPNFSATQP